MIDEVQNHLKKAPSTPDGLASKKNREMSVGRQRKGTINNKEEARKTGSDQRMNTYSNNRSSNNRNSNHYNSNDDEIRTQNKIVYMNCVEN